MIPLLAQLAADTQSIPHIEFQRTLPAGIPLGLVLLLIATAAVFSILLYRAQRKLASGLIIMLLTAIRLLLLLLILIMFLQPSMMWTNIHRSPGTLWLVVDQSGSMALQDPQSSAIEKLHWVDALHLLPDSKRKSKPGLLYARAYAADCLLKTLRPPIPYDTSTTSPDADRAAVTAFLDPMRDYSKRLHTLADDIDADDQVHAQSALGSNIRETAGLVDDGIRAASADPTLRAAILRFRWQDIHSRLQLDTGELHRLADKLDQAYLDAHKDDADLVAAMSRISGQSRADLVTQLFTSEDRSNAPLNQLLGQFRTRLVSFADSPQNIGEFDPLTRDQTLKGALIPGGKSTNIAAALELVGQQLSSEEKASVLLVTDSRQNVPGDPTDPARLLARRGVQVFGLLVGSEQVAPDAAVDHVDAPDWIYKDDTLQISATIRMNGLDHKNARVELRRGAEIIDTQNLVAGSDKDTKRIPFTDKPGEPGVYDYEIRVSEVPGEVNVANNRQSFRVAVKKDKLAALVIEEYPRWEFQYLSNFLARDQRMKLQTVLFNPAIIDGVIPPAAVKASPTNPQREAQILPQTREEWQAFDFVILGDIPPERLPPAQQQFLATAVRDRGTTLIVLAGSHSMPARYADTPLAALLPVQMSSDWTADAVRRHTIEGFRPGVAPQGGESILTQLGMDPSSNAQAWSAMPPWFWHSELTHAKDAATVLWTINDPLDPTADTLEGARKRALLSSITVGRGRVLYLASDQTWRLRQIQGDNLQERFWGQVVRWAVGTNLPAGGRFVRFGAEPQHAQQGTPITVTARIFHEDLTPYNGLTFEAVASTKATPTNPAKPVDRVAMKESPGDPGTYKGTFAGLPAGDLEITLVGGEVQRLLEDDPTVTLRSVSIQIDPQLNLEQENVETNPELLASITSAGGGLSLIGPYADILAPLMAPAPITRTTTSQVGPFTDPKSSTTLPLLGRVRTTFFIHWCILALFVALLTTEWIIRKRAGMV